MTVIQHRRGTVAEWTASNPILASGEKGYEEDTGRFKMGDGVLNWSQLDYYIPLSEVQEAIEAQLGQNEPGITENTYANAVPGTYFGVTWTQAGGFPPRPSSRTDIHFIVRMPSTAGNPPIAVPPATNGYYEGIDERSIMPVA